MNTENKDIANEMKKVTELDPEEPETIAGGREPRRPEWDSVLQVKSKLNYPMDYLNRSGNYQEISKLGERCGEALTKWKQDIANSPEGSPDIRFNKYFPV